MKSICIATEYYSKNIRYSEDIFLVDEIFEGACFWARESCREIFSTNSLRYDLVRKIDDIGMEVDRYMYERRFKILKNAQLAKNSLSRAMNHPKKAIKWFIERWINTFMNLSTNKKYKNYIDVRSVGLVLDEDMSHTEDILTFIINEEEKIEYEKQQKRRMENWDNCLIKMVENGQIGGESTESGRTQMVFLF